MARDAEHYSITVRFPAEDGEKLKAMAEAEDLSVGQVVRRAVREYLDTHKSKAKRTK